MPAIASRATPPTTTPAIHALLAFFSATGVSVGKDGADTAVSVGTIVVEAEEGSAELDADDDSAVADVGSSAPNMDASAGNSRKNTLGPLSVHKIPYVGQRSGVLPA